VIPDGLDANRSLSLVLAAQSIKRSPLITPLSPPLQPRPNQALDNQTPAEVALN
jgi:hypothetical protein